MYISMTVLYSQYNVPQINTLGNVVGYCFVTHWSLSLVLVLQV
jgi:hypothetical protein